MLKHCRTKFLLILLTTLVVGCSDHFKNQSTLNDGANAQVAFLQTVYPILKSECSECHSSGAHPFASSDTLKASRSGVGLMGISVSDSRFLKKVSNSSSPHPSQSVAQRVLPELQENIKKYFDQVENISNLENYVITKSVAAKSNKTAYPAINNLGFLIFEAEGTTVSVDTKLEVTSGDFQNSLGVTSTVFPPNPVSGEGRNYSVALPCSDVKTVFVTENLHVADQSIAKYVMGINARLYDPNNNDRDILLNNETIDFLAIHIMPKNTPEGSTTDNDYKTAVDPNNWNFENPLSASQKSIIYDRFLDIANGSTTTATALQTIIDTKGITRSNITDFLRITSTERIKGNYPKGSGLYSSFHTPTIITIDPSIANKDKSPGDISFTFEVPTYLEFGDVGEGESLRSFIYAKARGNYTVKVNEINPESKQVIKNALNCITTNMEDTSDWQKINAGMNLERGKTYQLVIQQSDETLRLDAFMVRVETEENNGDVNKDPTLTRFTGYGKEGEGVQQKINRISWPLAIGGSIDADIYYHKNFYEISSPVYVPANPANPTNLMLDGIDFLVNDSIARVDKSFIEQGIRPPYAIISYGSVLIPVEKGLDEDVIALAFRDLQLTDEQASLPSYLDPPPTEGIECRAPELFKKLVFPIYTQLPVMRRGDYNRWINPNSIYPYDYDTETQNVGTARFPTQYKCISCHNTNHPYFPMSTDYVQACNDALARSNLDNPYLSYALRGLRGQFEHEPLYIGADMTTNNASEPLNFVTIPNKPTVRLYYGTQNGVFESHTLPEIQGYTAGLTDQANIERIYRALQVPRQVGININPVTGPENPDLTDLNPLDPRFKSLGLTTQRFNIEGLIIAARKNPVTTTTQYNAEVAKILGQHEVERDKLVELFVKWLKEEKRLRQ